MTLAGAQALFYRLATGDPAAERGVVPLVFAGTPDLPADERVGIYAGMWLARLVDALRAAFPALAAVLGEEAFDRLAGAYLRAHPPEDPDVGQVGRRLPGFLRDHPELAPRPDLADLAALEWAKLEVFLEAPAEPMGREAFAELEPDSFASARLDLVPALRLVLPEHDAAGLLERALAGEPPGRPVPGPAPLAVWRRGFEVFHARLDPDEAAALGAALRREPLSEVCAPFAHREDPARAALAAIVSWVDQGFVVRLQVPH